MDETSPFEALGALAMLGILVVGCYFVVLSILAPFFWYGTNRRTKETSQKLDETNALLREIANSQRASSRQ